MIVPILMGPIYVSAKRITLRKIHFYRWVLFGSKLSPQRIKSFLWILCSIEEQGHDSHAIIKEKATFLLSLILKSPFEALS